MPIRRLAGIIASAMDAIISVDSDQRIVLFNRAAEKMFGIPAEQAIGQTLDRFIPGRLRERHRTHIEEFGRTGITCRSMRSPGTLLAVRASGEEFPIEATISQVDTSGEKTFTVIMRDISERQRAEAELLALRSQSERRKALIEAASQVALDVLASQTGSEALQGIADAARGLAHAEYAALAVLEPAGGGLAEFAVSGLTPEEIQTIGATPQGNGLLGHLLQRDEPLRLPDLEAHPMSGGFPPGHPVMKSFLGVPIRHGEQVLGSLYLANKLDEPEFSEEDMAAVATLAAHAAVAIKNLRMLARQRALVKGLFAAQEEERQSVAYELHDGLTQYVMAAHAHLEAFRRSYAANDDTRAKPQLEKSITYIKESVTESRRLINGLRSLALEDLGLAAALEQLLSEEQERVGWQSADYEHDIGDQRFDITTETAAYRVIQEALTNVRKHADSQRVRVTLSTGADAAGKGQCLKIEVRDWGRGFDPQTAAIQHHHFGLHSMQARVTLFGGTFGIDSAPGRGAAIRASFPIAPK